jgi:hypothetical protein
MPSPAPSSRPERRRRPAGSGPSGRRRVVPAAASVGVATLAVGVAAPSAQGQAPTPKPPHVIRTTDDHVSKLGPVRVNTRTSNLSNAYRSFGRPSSVTGKGTTRRVRWNAAGVSIVAATFGGCRRRTRCRTDELLVQAARVTGPRWQTMAGLRIGDPGIRISELYPQRDAPADGDGDVVLTTAYTEIGDPREIPIVTAQVRGGVIAGFVVWIGAAGD